MSKSLGNIVNPLDLIEEYGVDPVRYYLMREMVLGQDANFTMESFIKRYNSDLANDFGNLLNRVGGLINKYFDGSIPEAGEATDSENEIKVRAKKLEQSTEQLIGELKIHEAIEEILQLIRSVNKYLETQAPWKLAKTDLAGAGRVLYTATEALRIGAVHLTPVMPERTSQILNILGAEQSGPQWGGLVSGNKLKEHVALFPRIEIDK